MAGHTGGMSADAIARLVARLDAGEAKIQAAERDGKDVTAWVDLWISLLGQYCRAVDEQRQAAGRVTR